MNQGFSQNFSQNYDNYYLVPNNNFPYPRPNQELSNSFSGTNFTGNNIPSYSQILSQPNFSSQENTLSQIIKSNFENNIQKLSGKITNLLKEKLKTNFDESEKLFWNLRHQAQVTGESVQLNYENIKTKIDRFKYQVEQLESKVDEIGGLYDEYENNLVNLNALDNQLRLPDSEQSVSFNNTLTFLLGQIDNLKDLVEENQLTSNSSLVKNFSLVLDSFHEIKNNINFKFSSINEEIFKSFNSQYHSQSNDTEEINNRLVSIRDKLKSLETEISQIGRNKNNKLISKENFSFLGGTHYSSEKNLKAEEWINKINSNDKTLSTSIINKKRKGIVDMSFY